MDSKVTGQITISVVYVHSDSDIEGLGVLIDEQTFFRTPCTIQEVPLPNGDFAAFTNQHQHVRSWSTTWHKRTGYAARRELEEDFCGYLGKYRVECVAKRFGQTVMLTQGFKYHPQTSQLIMPRAPAGSYVIALAHPNPHKPLDLKAYVFSGKHGVHILPGVWYNSPCPARYSDDIVFDHKQPESPMCVVYDSVQQDSERTTYRQTNPRDRKWIRAN